MECWYINSVNKGRRDERSRFSVYEVIYNSLFLFIVFFVITWVKLENIWNNMDKEKRWKLKAD